jgi:dihydroorotate dehydrogenase
MPDWTYRTVFRPILAKLPFDQARRLALGSMGLLARTPVGRQIIQWMGHMAPPSELRTQWNGIDLPSPIGISSRLDPNWQATRAWAEFGVGIIEIGPIALDSLSPRTTPSRDEPHPNTIADWKRCVLRLTERSVDPTVCAPIVRQNTRLLWLTRIRLNDSGALPGDVASKWKALEMPTQAIALEWPEYVPASDRMEQAKSLLAIDPSIAMLLVTYSISHRDEIKSVNQLIANQGDHRLGLLIDLARPHWMENSVSTPEAAPIELHACSQDDIDTIANLRKDQGVNRHLIVTRGGIRQPIDALGMIKAGADLLLVDDGFVFSGPGLIKRIHSAIRGWRCQTSPSTLPSQALAKTDQNIPAWTWAMMLAAAMFFGGLITLWVSCRGVMLPYDEVYLQMRSEDIQSLAPRLMSFMAHDRVTLAGTMLGLGILYGVLGYFGLRRGMHWAQMTIWCSTLVGFLSFFSFLFFGYFDSLHGFISAVLISVAFQMVQSRLGAEAPRAASCLRDDRAWRLAQWGQLLLVVQGFSLIAAGATITVVASMFVFVAEDLAFLKMSVEEIQALHPRLVSVIAHDRATFGGMLLSCGVATLLGAMWGVDRNRPWLWWSWFLGGSIAYGATLIVHECVGYTDWRHLLPAAFGLLELWLGLTCLLPYMCFPTTSEPASTSS